MASNSAYELQRAAQQAKNRSLLQSFGLSRQVAPAVGPAPSTSASPPTTPKKRKTVALSPLPTPVRGKGSEAGSPGSTGSRTSARIRSRIAREELGEDFEDDGELVGGLLEDYDDELELGEDGVRRKRKPSSGRRAFVLVEDGRGADGGEGCSVGNPGESKDLWAPAWCTGRDYVGFQDGSLAGRSSPRALSPLPLNITLTGWNPCACSSWNLGK